MAPLRLPIALVAVDNVAHELTRLSIEESLRVIAPKQILIVTDDPRRISIDGAEYLPFLDETGGGMYDAMMALWGRVPFHLSDQVSHIIWQQWDSWVLDADQWTDEFLEYDYIGAPWPLFEGSVWQKAGFTTANNVGNGGFSLRSARMIRHVAEHHDDYPLSIPEDAALCRHLRPRLESHGFRWAPHELARRFSYEFEEHRTGGTFGYHSCYNWLWLLSEQERSRRISLATDWHYRTRAFRELLKEHSVRLTAKGVGEFIYSPEIFNVTTREQAKAIILTPDDTHTTEQRWTEETAWTYSLLEKVFPQDGSSLVDYGCGIGRLSKPLIELRGFSALGLDISTSMCRFAVEYVNSPKFLVSSPETLDRFAAWGIRFDYALATWSLQHSLTPQDDITRVSSALKPGGRLFVINTKRRMVPTRQGVWIVDDVDIWAMLEDEFRLIEKHDMPETLVTNPASAWGVFAKK